MYIPQSLSDIPFLAEVNFTYARTNMFLGKIPESLTDEEENAAIMAAVTQCGLWDVEMLDTLPFSLSTDIGLLNNDFRLVDGDTLSILRLYVHLKNVISQYVVDESKFTGNYHFRHKGVAYKIYRNAVKNAITGDFMYDVSYDCGQSAMEVQRVWAGEVAKDYSGTEYYNFHMRQIACLARSAKCKTQITAFDRAKEIAKRISVLQDIPSDVIKDLVFFFTSIYRDLAIIPTTNSFLKAYLPLEQAVIQMTTVMHLKSKAIESFNKRAWI